MAGQRGSSRSTHAIQEAPGQGEGWGGMGGGVEQEGCCRLVLVVTGVGAVMASLGVCEAVVFG